MDQIGRKGGGIYYFKSGVIVLGDFIFMSPVV